MIITKTVVEETVIIVDDSDFNEESNDSAYYFVNTNEEWEYSTTRPLSGILGIDYFVAPDADEAFNIVSRKNRMLGVL